MKTILLALVFAATTLSAAIASDRGASWQDVRALVDKAPSIAADETFETVEKGPVIVTFFASWCPPCTDEFQHLNSLAASGAYGDAQIIAVNLFEDFGGVENPERMARFIDRTAPQFPLLKGSEEIRKAFGDIDRIPTVVVYGRSGNEVWRFVHERNAEKTHATEADLVEALNKARAQ